VAQRTTDWQLVLTQIGDAMAQRLGYDPEWQGGAPAPLEAAGMRTLGITDLVKRGTMHALEKLARTDPVLAKGTSARRVA
jgi:hypothetical protein